jgi:hypothetical protein
MRRPMCVETVEPRRELPLIARDVRLGPGCSFPPPRQLAGGSRVGGEHGWARTAHRNLDRECHLAPGSPLSDVR